MRVEDRRDLIVAEPAGRYAARPPLVVDCSVLACVLFDEPGRDEAADAMSGHELYAPHLVDHELISVALKKWRLGFEDVVESALEDFTQLRLERCRVDPRDQWRRARDHELTAYDAAYLCLAVELKAPLATFDHGLGKAAQALLMSGGSAR